MESVNSEMENKSLTVNELKEAFFSLKTNKSTGYVMAFVIVLPKIVLGTNVTHYYIY